MSGRNREVSLRSLALRTGAVAAATAAALGSAGCPDAVVNEGGLGGSGAGVVTASSTGGADASGSSSSSDSVSVGPGSSTGTGMGGGSMGGPPCVGASPCGTAARWSKHFHNAQINAAAADGSGVVIAGTLVGQSNLGCGDLRPASVKDVFVTKLNLQGACQWQVLMGENLTQEALGLAVDANGDAVVIGTFESPLMPGSDRPGPNGIDLFVEKINARGTRIWRRTAGGPGAQYGRGIATIGTNVFVIGDFLVGLVAEGGPSLISQGGSDAFVGQITSDGGFRWLQQLGGTSEPIGGPADQFGKAVAVGGADQVIITGSFNGPIQIGDRVLQPAGTATMQPSSDAFVAKLRTGNGAAVWTKAFGAPNGFVASEALTADSVGNAIAAGHFRGPVTFSGSAPSGPPPNGPDDLFVVKLHAASGSVLWGRVGESMSAGGAFGLVPRPDDEVLVAGQLGEHLDLGNGPLQGDPNGSDALLARLDSGGAPMYSMAFGGLGAQVVHAVTAANAGVVYLAGDFQGTVNFGDGPMSAAGATESFLAQFPP